MNRARESPIGASWEHWDHGKMEVLWKDDHIQISIGHPDYKFQFQPERAQEFIAAIRTAIEQQAHGITYDNSEIPSRSIRVESPHINDSQEDELFHDEYHLQIRNKQGQVHAFWLDKECLLKIANEIEHVINHDCVSSIMTA